MAGEGRRRTARAVGAGFAALLAVTAVAACSDDGGSGSATTTSTSAGSGESTTTTIGPEGGQLVDLISSGLNTDYHARYVAPGAGGSPTGEGAFTAELWRKGVSFRQDSTVVANGAAQTLSAFVLPDRTVGCRRVDQGDWQCDPIPPSSVSKIQDQLLAAAQKLASVIVSVTESVIAGQDVRCFVFDPDAVEQEDSGAVEEICLTEGGLPARLVTESQTLELELLELTVDDGAFVPPV